MNLSPQNVVQKFKGPLLCRICGKPVAIEICKTDDGGKAVHDDCYFLKLKLEHTSKDAHQSF